MGKFLDMLMKPFLADAYLPKLEDPTERTLRRSGEKVDFMRVTAEEPTAKKRGRDGSNIIHEYLVHFNEKEIGSEYLTARQIMDFAAARLYDNKSFQVMVERRVATLIQVSEPRRWESLYSQGKIKILR